MFPPFESAAQFYPGLILWCDPNSYQMDLSTMPSNTPYDRKKARELRPCLVVGVDNAAQSLQVARLCATTPRDTRRWVRVDSPPALTWKLNDAWIWVGTPPVVAMTLNNHKKMHPHRDGHYSSPDVAAGNLQSYWVHRQNYLMRSRPTPVPRPTMYNASMNFTQPYMAPGSTIHTSAPNALSATRHPTYPSASGYPPTAYHVPPSPHEYTTLAPQPVVVPTEFTEQHPNAPGWWRNPTTGWSWHASHGLSPPSQI